MMLRKTSLFQTLEECSELDPNNHSDRQLYESSIWALLRSDPKQARRKIYPAMGSYIGEDFEYLLHQCLRYRPSTALVEAVVAANPTAVEELVSCCPLWARLYALHIAVYFQASIDIIRYLTNLYPKALLMKAQGENERTPFHILAGNPYDLDALKLFIEACPSALKIQDLRQNTPLFVAVKEAIDNCPKNGVEAIRLLANANPELITKRSYSYFRNTPFIYACGFGSYEVVKILLEACPDVLSGKTSPSNMHALAYACHRWRPLDILSLLTRHANPNALAYRPEDGSKTAFEEAWSQMVFEGVEYLFQQFNGDEILLNSIPHFSSRIPFGKYKKFERWGKLLASNHEHVRKIKLKTHFGLESLFLIAFLSELADNNETVEELSLDLGPVGEGRGSRRARHRVCEALRQLLRTNRTIKTVRLEAKLRDAVFEVFSKDNAIENLSIDFDTEEDPGPSFQERLAREVVNKTTLKRLSLRGHSRGQFLIQEIDPPIFYLDPFLTLLKSPHSLREIHISSFCLEYDILEVAQAIQSNYKRCPLEAVTLSECITSPDCKQFVLRAVAIFLDSCENLRKLGIARNGLGDDEIKAIAECLKDNTTLQELDYSGNPLTIVGEDALTSVLRDYNVTLQKLNLGPPLPRELDLCLKLNQAGRAKLKCPLLSKVEFVDMLAREEPAENEGPISEADRCSILYGFLRQAPHLWTA